MDDFDGESSERDTAFRTLVNLLTAHHNPHPNPHHRCHPTESDDHRTCKERHVRTPGSGGTPPVGESRCVVDRSDRRRRHAEVLPVRDSGEAARPPATEVPRPITRPPIAPIVRDICSAGRLTRCGAAARLYAGGWFCDDHRPGAGRHPGNDDRPG
ncbi:hypothetical protein [Kitasatospora sp. NPDC057500]|uniref:hypothetical protein n=1 Tax=Kitasatospora sp. NPDC057500 TaxID=3346151 RepID=UPI0036BD1E64